MTTTAALLAYLQGSVPLSALPAILTFEEGLWQAMDILWQRSIASISQGIVVEWGGLLELWQGHLRLVHSLSGTAESIRLLVPPTSHFVGSYHTHPHPVGYTGIGFSGADFADAVNQGERISIVQSGQHIFMMLPLEETPANLELDVWRTRMNMLFEQSYKERNDILAASLVANQMICQELQIALYYGRIFRQLLEVYQP